MRFCQRSSITRAAPEFGFWAAVERSTGQFIGWFHLRPDEGAQPGEVELGYRLRRSAWGRGYATGVGCVESGLA